MKNKILHIILLLIVTQIKMIGQEYLLGVRNSNYEGFTILTTNGKVLFNLDLHADPVTGNVIIGLNSYSKAITIPLNHNKFIVRYANQFYIMNTDGEIVNKLHPNTEWVYNWETDIPRVSLKNFPNEDSFKDLYIDTNGNNLFNDEIFDDADDFLGELAPVRRYELDEWILIDKSGKEKIRIQSMLEEDSETLYNAFHDIWSYRKKSTHEERYVTKNGFNSENLSTAINNFHDLNIDGSLIKHGAVELGEFLLNSTNKHIFIRNRDKEGNMVQALYDRNLNKIDIVKPEEKGRYFFLRGNQDYIYGTFEYENQQKESIVVDIKSNTIIFKTKDLIHTVIDGNVLSNSGSNYRLMNLHDNLIFESQSLNHLKVDKNYESIVIPNQTEILEINGFEGEKIPSNILEQSENIKTLVLIECRELDHSELSTKHFPNLKNLAIKRCNLLKNYNPWENNFPNLQTYTNGLKVEFNEKAELTVSNKRR